MKDKSLGPYTLLKRLAVGGTAEIYLARKSGQLGGFEKYYALKVILPQRQGDEEAEKIFVDEARLTSQLQHDNIVGVLDLDQDDGRVFMVMEYVRGQDLSMVLDALKHHNGLLATEVAAYVARETCAGLQYVHSRKSPDGQPLGLVHRDISPQNVIVGVEGDVKIIDFGVAKTRGQGRIETQTGIIKGKLRYMAPEYAIGNQQDARSDIFAVGLCLFELMTGKPAYDDTNQEGLELVERIKTANIPVPSTLRQDVPPQLDAICMKALAAHPEDRYQTALEMQKELSVYLAGAAPDFTKAHLSTYISRLFEKLGILPEVASEVNADGIDAGELRASREKRAAEAPTQAVSIPEEEDASFGESSDPELEDTQKLAAEPEPTDVALEVKSIRGAENSWNTPTGELQLEDGAPRLASESAQESAEEDDAGETSQLLTPSGFNQLVKRKPDEDNRARIEFGPDRVKTMDLKIPSPTSLRRKKPEKSHEPEPLEDEPPAEIEVSIADRIPTEEGEVLTSANDVTIPVTSPPDMSLPTSPDREPTEPTESIAEAPTEGLERPANAVLPGAPEPFSRASEPRRDERSPAARSQPMPVQAHPMTGAPIDDSHADSSAAFPAHHEAPTGANPVPSQAEQQPKPPTADVSASFQARPAPSNPDISGSFQARPGQSPADRSAGFQARPGATATPKPAASPDSSQTDMSASFNAAPDMSGTFQPAPEKVEGGTGSRVGFRGLKAIQDRYYEWISTERGRKKANLIVVAVIGIIFMVLMVWTLFMLPE